MSFQKIIIYLSSSFSLYLKSDNHHYHNHLLGATWYVPIPAHNMLSLHQSCEVVTIMFWGPREVVIRAYQYVTNCFSK